MVVESTLAPLPSPDGQYRFWQFSFHQSADLRYLPSPDLTFTIAIELKEPDAPQYDDRHVRIKRLVFLSFRFEV